MSNTKDTLAALIDRYEQLVGKVYRGTLELRGQAEKYEADLRLAMDVREAYRSGQLVPVPSVESVESVGDCPSSHDGRHHVDTSMESGPYNCFHCERPMR